MSQLLSPEMIPNRPSEEDMDETACIALSGMDTNRALLERLCADLGVEVMKGTKYNPKTTHMVAPKESTTAKSLSALVSCRWMMSADWVTESAKAGRLLPEKDYGYRLERPPFSGQSFFIPQGADETGSLRNIVEFGGGAVMDIEEDANRIIVQDYTQGPPREVTMLDLVKDCFPSRLGGTVRKMKRQAKENVRRRRTVKDESKQKRSVGANERNKEERNEVLRARRELPNPPSYTEEHEPPKTVAAAPTSAPFFFTDNPPLQEESTLFLPRIPENSFHSPEHSTINTSTQYPHTGGEKRWEPTAASQVHDVAKSLHFAPEMETRRPLSEDFIFSQSTFSLDAPRSSFASFFQQDKASKQEHQHQPATPIYQTPSTVIIEDESEESHSGKSSYQPFVSPINNDENKQHYEKPARSQRVVTFEDEQKPKFERPPRFVPEARLVRRHSKPSMWSSAHWLMLFPVLLLALFAYRLAKPPAPLTAEEFFTPTISDPSLMSRMYPPAGQNERVAILVNLEEQPEAQDFVDYLWRELHLPADDHQDHKDVPTIYGRVTRGDHECLTFRNSVADLDGVVVCFQETSFPEPILESRSPRKAYYISKDESGKFHESENQKAIEHIAKDLRKISRAHAK